MVEDTPLNQLRYFNPDRPPIRITMRSALNKSFAEWSTVFPNAACVVSLVDRRVRRSEVIVIEGESYRLKEAKERSEQRGRQRRKKAS